MFFSPCVIDCEEMSQVSFPTYFECGVHIKHTESKIFEKLCCSD